MKFLLIFILSILLGFRTLFPIIEYLADYTYISEVLCINKEKPKMACHGKCYLKKELAKTTEENTTQSEKKDKTTSSKLLSDFFLIEDKFNCYLAFIKLGPTNKIQCKSNHYNFNLHLNLLKPPIF